MSTTEALRHLYKDGGGGISGLTRFYRGYFPALMQVKQHNMKKDNVFFLPSILKKTSSS